jgi:hypothetical protein
MNVRKNGGAGNLLRSEAGMWRPQHASAKLTIYQKKLVEYLNFLDPIFRNAQAKDEFGFLWALLGIRRLGPVKWRSFEVLQDTDKIFGAVNDTLGTWNGANTHTGLFRYGLIVESDELYGFFMNLLRCLNDEPPYVQPFAPTLKTDKKGVEKKISLKPKDKITQLKNLASECSVEFYPYDEFYDNKLRNAVFHSSYHFDPSNGTLTIIGDSVVMRNKKAEEVPTPDKIYTQQELLKLVNGAFAFFDAVIVLRRSLLDIYDGGLEIEGTHNFATHMFTTVAKNRKGLVGLMETGGPVPFEIPFEAKMSIGTFTPQDITALKNKQYNLKLSPNEKAQLKIDSLPRRFQKYAGRYYKWRLSS